MRMHVISKAIAFVSLLALAAFHASGSPDPVMARGFNKNQVYSFEGFDSVNAYNGNLMVTVPLGREYRTNGTLSYAFVLQYNAKFWEFHNHPVGPTSLEQGVTSHFLVPSFAEVQSGDGGAPGTGAAQRMEAYPSRMNNAGLGWMLSLGEVRERALDSLKHEAYIDESGAEHPFTGNTLHGARTVADGASLTQDGSYLRLTRNSAVTRTVEFPDGTRKRFTCASPNAGNTACQSSGIGRVWQLDQITDPLGNVLWVTRSADRLTWTFKEGTLSADRHANMPADLSAVTTVREHTLYFELANELPRLKRARLAAPHGQTVDYELEYETRKLARPSGSQYIGPDQVAALNGGNGQFDVSWLRRVKLPEDAGKWEFDYLQGDPCPIGAPAGECTSFVLPPSGQFPQAPVSNHSGLLKRLKLPLGGGAEYTWGTRTFLNQRCVTGASAKLHGYRSAAVTRRQLIQYRSVQDAVNATTAQTVGEPWLYWGTTAPLILNREIGVPPQSGNPDCTEQRQYVAAVVDPLGNMTATYHSLYRYDASAGWLQDEHSLPFSRLRPDPDDASLFLSKREYKCTLPNASIPANDLLHTVWFEPAAGSGAGTPGPCGHPFKETYVRYVNQGTPCAMLGPSMCQVGDARLEVEKTRFYREDSNGLATAVLDSHSKTEFQEWNGASQYKVVQSSGTFGRQNFGNVASNDALDQRTERTNYTYAFSALPSSPWLLNLYDRKETTDPSGTQVRTFQFDAASGVLLSQRTLAGAVANDSKDLTVRFERTRDALDPAAVTTVARYAGGDERDQSEVQYVMALTKRYGETARTEYRSCNAGSLIEPRENNGIDRNTGLVVWSDPSGDRHADDMSPGGSASTTFYQYDLLGRLETIRAPGDAPSMFTYQTGAEDSVGARVEQHYSSSARGPSAQYVFDAFGRLTVERTMQPRANGGGDGCTTNCDVWTEVERAYKPNGWLESETTRHARGTTGKRTQYEYRNPSGKPWKIVKPDHSNTGIDRFVLYAYNGTRERQTTVRGLALESGNLSTVTEKYDRFGRLVEVTESSKSNTPAATRYEYDVDGKLTKVRSMEGTSAANLDRKFVYDGRGLLLEESYPELGVGVKIVHDQYDARGNAGRSETLSGGTAETLERRMLYTYDGSERILSVTDDGQPYKAYTYYGSTAPAMSRWKLENAIRFNYVRDVENSASSLVARQVDKQHEYSSEHGRPSAMTLSVGSALTARTTLDYDDFGGVERVGYPSVTAGCGTTCPPSREVRYRQSRGLVTSILQNNQNVATLDYHPNGMLWHVRHADTSVDTHGLDPSGLPRVASITTDFGGTSANWTTGTYVYDGAGNVREMGSDEFRYDQVGRLTQARIGNQTQTYGYDRYGNMTSRGTVDVQTNQLRLADGFAYDRKGNLVRMPGIQTAVSYTYDPFNRITEVSGDGQGRVHLYDADDERVGTTDYTQAAIKQLWTLRGMDNAVLRELTKTGTGALSWSRDYVHRPGGLLAQITPTETLHFHLDHLGTPRRASKPSSNPASNGAQAGAWNYFPFGEAIVADPNAPRLRFTGHERDDDGTVAQTTDLDYMHARYYRPVSGRFLSIDPVLNVTEAVGEPQLWNRYSYVTNNPMSSTDPDGRYRTFYKEKKLSDVGNPPPLIKTVFAIQGGLLMLPAGGAVLRGGMVAHRTNQAVAGSELAQTAVIYKGGKGLIGAAVGGAIEYYRESDPDKKVASALKGAAVGALLGLGVPDKSVAMAEEMVTGAAALGALYTGTAAGQMQDGLAPQNASPCAPMCPPVLGTSETPAQRLQNRRILESYNAQARGSESQ